MKKIFLTILCLYFTTIKFTLAFDVKVRQAILMDYDTGEILFQKNANDRVYPSSMTKIMTTYIIFEKLKNGRLFLTDKILISNNAWKQEGSRMFLDIGSNVSIEELLKGVIVQSGNDASYALAEGTAGTVYEFVNLMNQKAKEMGLENTNFTNPIGFTENNHYMSVKDTAILSKRLIQDFPEYYAQYFAIPEYKYNKITQQNRNELLKTYEGADGIKTGHTEAAGYSLAASAYRNNRRLIAVINGANTKKDRIEESKNLLNYGFSILTKYTFYKAGEVIKEIPIFYGKEKKVNIISNTDITATSKNKDQILVNIELPESLNAPITKDDKIGKIILTTESDTLEYNLYPEIEVKKANIFKRFFLWIYYTISNIFN